MRAWGVQRAGAIGVERQALQARHVAGSGEVMSLVLLHHVARPGRFARSD